MKRNALMALWSIAIAHGSPAFAQDENAEKKALTEAKELLDAQKGVLEAQKGILDAQKGLLDAKYPKISGGKDGTLTAGTGSLDAFHAQVQAYAALKPAVAEVCKLVNAKLEPKPAPKEGKPGEPNSSAGQSSTTSESPTSTIPVARVAVLSDEDIKWSGQYQIAAATLLNIRETYTALVDKPDPATQSPQPQGQAAEPSALKSTSLDLYGAGLALTSIADFTKLFRTNRTLHNESTTIPADFLADQIVSCLGDNVSYPAAMADSVIASGNSAFVKSLAELNDPRKLLDAEAMAIEIVPADKRKPDQVVRLATLKALANRHDAFASALVAVDATTKTPGLFYLLRGEIVNAAMGTGYTPVLTVNAKSGGFSLLTSNIWSSDSLYSSGGVIVAYRLAAAGKVLAAGSVSSDSGLQEIHKLH